MLSPLSYFFQIFRPGWVVTIRFWLITLCQLILMANLVFASLASVPVKAQEVNNGIIGFSSCRFGSAEEIRQRNNAPAGNETMRQCLQQILTFVFVLGIFLIGMRIAIEAFKSLNPAISGNSIDNSVKLGKDVVIGLILIGAPSIFLGLFNEAALQLPNLFELSRFAPKEGQAQTDKPAGTSGGGTGTGATGTGGTNTPGTTSGPGGGTGGGIGAGDDLTVDGRKVPQTDIEAAKKARSEGKSLTAQQEKILEALDKQTNPNQKIYVSNEIGELTRSEVETALKAWQDNKLTTTNAQANKGLDIAKGLLENCLTNPAGGDQTSCEVLKSNNINPADRTIFIDYNGSKELKLPIGFNRTNPNNTTVGQTGTDYKIQLRNTKGQEAEIIMKCPTTTVAQTSPLTQSGSFSSSNHLNQNLIPQGCTAEMRVTKI